MKICIVGCGNQSTGLAGLLAQESKVESILFLGRRMSTMAAAKAQIETLGERMGDTRIDCLELDCHDSDAVARATRGCAVIFNGTTPAFNLPLMKAALLAGANYMDVWSNGMAAPGIPYEETIDAQMELDNDFRQAGLTAVPACGLSGFDELAAGYMARDMDRVDAVIVRVMDWIDSTELLAPLPPAQVFDLWLGAPGPTVLIDGKICHIPLLESEESFDFPAPIGRQTVYTFAKNPELPLLQRLFPEPIGRIEVKMGISMGGLAMKDVWLQALSEQTAKHTGAENMFELFAEPLDRHNESFDQLMDQGILKGAALSATVEVTGEKDGAPRRHTMYHTTTLEESTKHLPWTGHNVYGTVGGIVLELILTMGRGDLPEKGTLNLADLSDAQGWFRRFRARGHLVGEKIEYGNGIFVEAREKTK